VKRQAPVAAPVASSAPDELAAWLARAARGRGRVDLELFAGDRTVYVLRWSEEHDPAATVAGEIRAAASADGELQAAPVAYALTATDETGETIATVPLRVSGPLAAGPLATGSGADLLSTAHRHLESQASLNLRLLTSASEAIRAMADQARMRAAEDQEELRWYRERARQIRDEREELTRETIARELASEVGAERERRTSALLEQAAAAVLPAVARRLSPAPAPAPATGRTAADDALDRIRAAWAHLSPELCDRIADELPPEIALGLVGAIGGGASGGGAPPEPH